MGANASTANGEQQWTPEMIQQYKLMQQQELQQQKLKMQQKQLQQQELQQQELVKQQNNRLNNLNQEQRK